MLINLEKVFFKYVLPLHLIQFGFIFGLTAFQGAMLALTAVSAVKGIQAQQESAEARREASRKQQGLQEIQAAKARQQAVRESRARRAQLQAQASGAGVQGSSGLGGAVSSATAGLASNIGLQATQTAFSRSIAGDIGRAQQAQGEAQMYGSIGGLAGSFIDFKQLGISLQGGGKTSAPTFSTSGIPFRN